jgi:hypothetical protein
MNIKTNYQWETVKNVHSKFEFEKLKKTQNEYNKYFKYFEVRESNILHKGG